MFRKWSTSFTVICLTSVSSFGMSFVEAGEKVVEERPSLGFYADFGSIDKATILYKEQISNDPSYEAMNYNETSISTTPTIGFAGHIPFLWNKYFDATATVGFNSWDITAKKTQGRTNADGDFLDPTGNVVPEDRLDRSFNVFNVIIEGGPELGFPIYEDYDSQQLVKPFVQVRGIFIKTFNQSNEVFWKNKQAFGYAYVGGLRYSFNNISIGAGVRSEVVSWTPLYDPTEGDSAKNDLDITYERNFKPWLAVEFSFY